MGRELGHRSRTADADSVKVSFSRAATSDIIRLRSFLEAVAPRAARNAVIEILQGCSALSTFPNRGRLRKDGSRQIVVRFGVSGYIVRYRVDAEMDQVVILRIRHAREREEG